MPYPYSPLMPYPVAKLEYNEENKTHSLEIEIPLGKTTYLGVDIVFSFEGVDVGYDVLPTESGLMPVHDRHMKLKGFRVWDIQVSEMGNR